MAMAMAFGPLHTDQRCSTGLENSLAACRSLGENAGEMLGQAQKSKIPNFRFFPGK